MYIVLCGMWLATGIVFVIISRFFYMEAGDHKPMLVVAVVSDITGAALIIASVFLYYGIFDYLETLC